jgi:hypothetical protein
MTDFDRWLTDCPDIFYNDKHSDDFEIEIDERYQERRESELFNY